VRPELLLRPSVRSASGEHARGQVREALGVRRRSCGESVPGFAGLAKLASPFSRLRLAEPQRGAFSSRSLTSYVRPMCITCGRGPSAAYTRIQLGTARGTAACSSARRRSVLYGLPARCRSRYLRALRGLLSVGAAWCSEQKLCRLHRSERAPPEPLSGRTRGLLCGGVLHRFLELLSSSGISQLSLYALCAVGRPVRGIRIAVFTLPSVRILMYVCVAASQSTWWRRSPPPAPKPAPA